MSSLAFVTALYAIRDGYTLQLLTEFQRLLAALPVATPVIVFTDQELPFADRRLYVIRAPLTAFQTYTNMLAAAPQCTLPATRNVTKDTLTFLALMNTKTEMVWTADSLLRRGVFQGLVTTPTHLAWIDCGIHKIFRATDDVSEALRRIVGSPLPANKILMPGCWSSQHPQEHVSANAVSWRFCGGFFVVPRDLAARFYHAAEWTRTTRFADRPTWEVNVWAATEKWEPALFAWWPADHDIRLLEIPTSLLVSHL